jgi:hypothetical protein
MTLLNLFNHFNEFKSDEITESVQSFHIKWNHSISSHQMEFSNHFTSDVIFLSVYIRWNDPISLLNSHQMKLFNSFTHFIHVSWNESIQSVQSGHSVQLVQIIWTCSMISFRPISSHQINFRQSVHIKWNGSISLMISINSDQMK